MDHTAIQERMNDLSRAMLAKGLPNPSAQFHIEANVEPLVYMRWGEWSDPDFTNQIIRCPEINQTISAAFARIEGLPSQEEVKRQKFMASLAKVIDIGREGGIEIGFLNPLTETMKRLSENALTYQPAPIDPEAQDAADYDDGNITDVAAE